MTAEVVSRSLLSATLSTGSMRCFCLFAAVWVWVFWASAPVIEVGVVQTLRRLLTLGVLSFISLSSSLWSFLGGFEELGPCGAWSVTPTTLCLTVSLVLCTLAVSTSIPPSCTHSKAGIRWWQTQRLRMQAGGTVAWARWVWSLGALFHPSFFSPLSLVWSFCWWTSSSGGQSVWKTPALWVASVSKGHVCCICISCLALGLHQGL